MRPPRGRQGTAGAEAELRPGGIVRSHRAAACIRRRRVLTRSSAETTWTSACIRLTTPDALMVHLVTNRHAPCARRAGTAWRESATLAEPHPPHVATLAERACGTCAHAEWLARAGPRTRPSVSRGTHVREGDERREPSRKHASRRDRHGMHSARAVPRRAVRVRRQRARPDPELATHARPSCRRVTMRSADGLAGRARRLGSARGTRRRSSRGGHPACDATRAGRVRTTPPARSRERRRYRTRDRVGASCSTEASGRK
jgi:hypothetical protein